MRIVCYFIMFIARLLISSIFLLAGVGKFIDISSTEAFMATKNIPAMPYLYLAAITEILGGFSVLLGFKARYGAILLILFLIPTTYIFHDFWNIQDKEQWAQQFTHFFGNMAIIGGLLYVVCFGAGGWGFDKSCCPHKPKAPEEPPKL